MSARAWMKALIGATTIILALPLVACGQQTPEHDRETFSDGKAPLLIVVRPEQVDSALALAKTLPVPQPTTKPADGGLVFIAFPPLTEEQSSVVAKSGLVQMSTKTGAILN